MGEDFNEKSKRNREEVLKLWVDDNWFKRKNWEYQQIRYKKCYSRRAISFLKIKWNLDRWTVESYSGVRFGRFNRVQGSDCKFEKRRSWSEFSITWLEIFCELAIPDCVVAKRSTNWNKGW